MSLFPDAQRQAQEEIDRVIGRSRLPTLADRGQLPYISALLNEVYRWRPVVTLGSLSENKNSTREPQCMLRRVCSQVNGSRYPPRILHSEGLDRHTEHVVRVRFPKNKLIMDKKADKLVEGECSITLRYILIRRSSLQSVSSRGTENQRSGILAYVILALGDGKAKHHL